MRNSESRTISQPVETHGPPIPFQPFVFVVLNADDLAADSSRHALGEVDEVQFRRGTTRETFRVQHGGKRQLILTFPDPWMSSVHARLVRRGAEWFLEDAGSKNGTFVAGCRTPTAHLSKDAVLELGHTFLVFRPHLPTPPGSAPDGAISEHHWLWPEAPRQLRPASTHLCSLHKVQGDLKGFGESLRVLVAPDGFWYLNGTAGSTGVAGSAYCVDRACFKRPQHEAFVQNFTAATSGGGGACGPTARTNLFGGDSANMITGVSGRFDGHGENVGIFQSPIGAGESSLLFVNACTSGVQGWAQSYFSGRVG